MWDHMTGLLLIYPSCVLHVIEVSFTANKYSQHPSVMKVCDVRCCVALSQSSREVLVSVLKDLKDLQQQPDW